MRFHVLGGLVVTDGETPVDLGTPKQRAVVAVLLLERDQVVATDRLIELLWGDDNDKALVSLRAYVSRLRAILEPGRRPRDAASVLVSQAPGYRLSVPRGDVDLFRFEDQVADGRRLLRDGDHSAAAGVLDAALSTWTGPVLPELANEPFVVAAAARAEEVRLAAIESVVEAWLALGDPGEALARVEPFADRHPTRERMQGLHALALYRSGRQAEALQVVDRCRRALVDDHGLELGGELRQLESDLLSHAPGLDLVDLLPTEEASAVTERSGAAHPVEPMETSMVGRVAERAILRDALSAAEVGRGSVVVLVGEPGIGKSHLAEEAVAMAPASFATAWVRCPESRATPPFWALSHMRDQLATQLPPGTLAPVVVPTEGRDGHAGREVALAGFGLSRSVLDQILAADHPILLVVDDLQWSDPDSLRLIEHLAADLALTRVLLVLTTRPLRDDSEDALVDCLAEISRLTTARQIEIGGLSLAEVTEWLGRRDGFGELDPVASVLHERTGGNPLFVKELTQLLDAEGRLDDPDAVSDARAIPPGVRFVVRRRVSRLPRPTQQLLSTAAVMGSPFRIDILSAVAGADDQAVLSDLAPALAEGLLVTWRADLAFSHALVGEALASEMNPARAAAIHAAMARALAEAAGPGFGTAAAEIAHHALEGILAGTGELAVEASRRAAELAARRGAEEDAAAHWGHLAFALGRVTPGDTTAIADAWIAQAESLTRADRTSAAKEPILAAVDVAAEAGNTEAMARAASLCNLTHVWTNEAYGSVDQRLLDALERTLDALGHGDPEQRAVLLGALASELVFADPERHRETCAAAESAAREAGDPTVLVRVLNNLILPNRPAQLDERRRLTNEMVDVATRHDLPDALVYAAHHHVAEVHLEMGDLDAAADELVVARRVLDGMPRSHLHGQQLWAEAALANARGRFDTASELISQAHELHRKGRAYDADMVLLAARVAVAIDHGGLEDLIPFAVETAGSTTYGRVASEAVAFSMLELGRPDLARSLVEPFAHGNDLPDDYTTLLGAAATVHVRIELGDVEAAEPAAALLAPYADRWSGAGISPLTMGPVSLALALHRAALGDDRADADFVESVAACETNGAVGWLARSLAHQADFLDVHGDLAGAAGARSRAWDLATRHGLPYVLRRLDAVAST